MGKNAMSATYTITEDHVDLVDPIHDVCEGQFPWDFGTCRIERHHERSQFWLHEAAEQLRAISRLAEDWDGDQAASPDRMLLYSALSFLWWLHQVPGIPKPHINPTRDGGVQFEWEAGPRYFEVEVVGRGAASYFYQDQDARIEQEGEIFEDEPLTDVVRYIELVASAK
jgi:hypothetical protein